MANTLFVVSLAAFFAMLFFWGFRVLPLERWQFAFAVPVRRADSGEWKGTNYTFYGFFQASALVLAVALFVTLLGSIRLHIPLVAIIAVAVPIAAVCLLSAKLIAQIVEKKRHTFTVGGACFAGTLVAPLALWMANETIGRVLDFQLPIMPVLAAAATAYALGEG